MPEVKAPPIYRVVLDRWFDVDDARYYERYLLQESKLVGVFRKRRKWVPVMVDGYDGFEIVHKGARASGDEDWAKRIMEEFHIRGVTVL